MRLAIVGSTQANGADARRAVREVLDRYNPDVIVSGGAEGADTIAAEEAAARGIAVQIFRPKVMRWRDGFMPRNKLIAENCDALVRIVSPRSRTYGSGWTRDYAKKIGKPTEEIKL
jgi:predicted Rossmann fold nucleotide-binding protein DprA/Smf involved in DNA uptake